MVELPAAAGLRGILTAVGSDLTRLAFPDPDSRLQIFRNQDGSRWSGWPKYETRAGDALGLSSWLLVN